MKKLVLYLALISTYHSESQIKFYEGYIVTTKGDTLTGYMRWQSNDKGIIFKKGELDESEKYPWQDITYAYNKRTEQSILLRDVTFSLEYLDREFIIREQDSVINMRLPLIRIYQGQNLSLYEYSNFGIYYYFIYDGNDYHQLIQKYRYLTERERSWYKDPVPRYLVLTPWKGFLGGYYNFNEDKRLRFLLENTMYDRSQLRSLISKMDSKMK